MSILLWTLLIWFVPGLIAGACLLLLTMRDRRAAMTPSYSIQSEGEPTEDMKPMVQEAAVSDFRHWEEEQDRRRLATTLAARPDVAFMLRVATTSEQPDEERQAFQKRKHHAHATSSGQHHR
jgi:hypothetical protein